MLYDENISKIINTISYVGCVDVSSCLIRSHLKIWQIKLFYMSKNFYVPDKFLLIFFLKLWFYI